MCIMIAILMARTMIQAMQPCSRAMQECLGTMNGAGFWGRAVHVSDDALLHVLVGLQGCLLMIPSVRQQLLMQLEGASPQLL
jgi:hypothetical protein